jgi:hypothetical protein
MTTATRIHGRDQLKARLIMHMRLGPCHFHTTGFNRLAQRTQRLTRKLRQFIEK